MMQDATENQNATGSSVPHRSRTGRLQLALLIVIPSLAMGLAWFLYFFGTEFVPTGRTNKGELIMPPASFQSMKLQGESGEFVIEQLEGKWGILVFGDSTCSSRDCQETLYQTRQAHIALGRESDRVVRVFIAPEQLSVQGDLKEEHPGLIWLGSHKESVIKTLNTQEWPENQYFIVDPLGNIMMRYQSAQYGRDVLKDLQKLLKASNIG